MESKQPEALRLAGEYPELPEWSKRDDLGGLVPSQLRQALRAYVDADRAANALGRLHAENTALQSGYDAARLEIASLQAEVANCRKALKPSTYAGCVVWAGDYRVMRLMSETEVRAWRFSCDPLKHLAEVCTSELANYWKKQTGETP